MLRKEHVLEKDSWSLKQGQCSKEGGRGNPDIYPLEPRPCNKPKFLDEGVAMKEGNNKNIGFTRCHQLQATPGNSQGQQQQR